MSDNKYELVKMEFEDSKFYKEYSEKNKYYVEHVLKYVFNKSISRVSNCKVDNKDYNSATYSQIVEQNCKVIGDFIENFVKPFFEKYKSDKIEDYKEVIIEMIEGRMIEGRYENKKGKRLGGIYLDPDSHFNNEEIKDEGFENITFSYDGLISIKNILDFNEGTLLDKGKFITEYMDCREKPIFFFPSRQKNHVQTINQQKNRVQTINQGRYQYFIDRIDYLLFDIKNYLDEDKKECKMKEIYENGDTKKWLDIVKSKGRFKYLVKLYNIDDIFVKKIRGKYKVIDIENNDGHSFIEKYREEESYNWTPDYYNNLKSLISKYNGRH